MWWFKSNWISIIIFILVRDKKKSESYLADEIYYIIINSDLN